MYIKCGKVSVRTYIHHAGRRQLSSEWRHNENDIIMTIAGLWRYGEWRHAAMGCNVLGQKRRSQGQQWQVRSEGHRSTKFRQKTCYNCQWHTARRMTWNWVTKVLFKPANHRRQCRESPRTIPNAFRCHRHKLMTRRFPRQVWQQEFPRILAREAQIVGDPVSNNTGDSGDGLWPQMTTIITQQHGENIKVSAQTDIMTLTHHHINTVSRRHTLSH